MLCLLCFSCYVTYKTNQMHQVDFYAFHVLVFCFFCCFPERDLQPSAHPFCLKASIFTPLDCRLFKTDVESLSMAAEWVRVFFGWSHNPIIVGITFIVSASHLFLRSEGPCVLLHRLLFFYFFCNNTSSMSFQKPIKKLRKCFPAFKCCTYAFS